MRIEVAIERLVMEGFEPHERLRIAESVRRELTRALESGIPPAGLTRDQRIERIDAGSLPLEPAATHAAVGAQVAGALLGSLKR